MEFAELARAVVRWQSPQKPSSKKTRCYRRLEQLEPRIALAADGLCGEIHGFTWNDLDGNGMFDEGEPGLGGVTVFSDVNQNGVLDPGEPSALSLSDDPSTQEDEAGHYWMRDVPVGQQMIREIVPHGFKPSSPSEGIHLVTIEPRALVEGVDFGNITTEDGSEIGGHKWRDLNRDAVRDANEPGIAGVVVYIDTNGNGVHNAGEPATETSEDGSYQLQGLPPGDHSVRETVPDGFEQTFPPSGRHIVTLQAGDRVDGIDFGNTRDLLGEIHGVKWHDTSRDGARDANEPGIGGVVIYLDANNNAMQDAGELSTRTSQDGNYWLVDLPAGDYVVREVIPSGLEPTAPADGFHVITLQPGEVVGNVDFGNVADQRGEVRGVKWRDDNGDRFQDSGEPGMAGVLIYSDQNGNGQFDAQEPATQTMTDIPETELDESGLYWLLGLEPGEHVIREVASDGFLQTVPVGGEHVVSVVVGDPVEQINFGNQPKQGEVHGVKWQDDNGDGIRDDNEPGLAGVIVYSDANGNGRLDGQEPATRTLSDDPRTEQDESGQYRLEVPSGALLVREIVPEGFDQTYPSADTGAPGSDGQPSEADSGAAHVLNLDPGGVLTGIDFGNRLQTGSVHGTKWQDDNGNGRRDDGEPGLAGVTVYADLNNNQRLDSAEPVTQTRADDPNTALDESGQYGLEGLRPGNHLIREAVPDGYQQSFPTDGQHAIEVVPNARITGADFGNQLETGSLHGTKWQDDNANGRRDDDEPGLAGVVIYSDTNNNRRLDPAEPSTETLEDDPDTAVNEEGAYWLEGLRPGRHVIREVVPEEFQQTFPSVGQHVVEVEANVRIDGIDFGNQPLRPGTVNGTTWRDDNGNGVRDQAEPAYAGVVVYADLNRNGSFDDDEPNSRTMVDNPDTADDETGQYWLTGLPPGRHTIREVVPKFFEQTHPPNNAYDINLPPGATLSGLDFFNRSLFLPGDTDRDGDVDFDDFVNLSNAFGGPGDWTNGDFNGDGLVSFNDFVDVSIRFGSQRNPAAVDAAFLSPVGFKGSGLFSRSSTWSSCAGKS